MVNVLNLFWGRNDSRIVRDEKYDTDVTVHSDADTLSLEARNEKEVRDHPTEVTGGAQEGVQKIEAAALVWNQPTVWAIYAW